MHGQQNIKIFRLISHRYTLRQFQQEQKPVVQCLYIDTFSYVSWALMKSRDENQNSLAYVVRA